MTAPAYVGTGPAIWDPGTQWAPSLTVTAAAAAVAAVAVAPPAAPAKSSSDTSSRSPNESEPR